MLNQVISQKTGWTRVAFGDVVRLWKERSKDPESDGYHRVVGLEHIDPGDLRVRRWGDISDGTTFTSLFRPGQVLFGKRRAYQRKVAIAEFAGVCSGDIYVLEPSSGRLMRELLPFICQTDAFFEHAIGTSAGSLSPRTNWKSLASFEFLLPPIQQQGRLIDALSAAEDLHSRLYDLEKAVNTARLSIYLDYFVRDRHAKANACVGDIATIRNGTTPSRKNPDFWEGEVPWLPTAKVNERYITTPDEYITQEALAKCSLRMIPAKSTLIAMIGQGTTRGKSAFLEIDSTINQNFAAVTPGSQISPAFLFYQLDACYEPLRHWSHGSNQHALNTKLVGEFPIWVPDERTQREIAETIAQLETGVRRAADRLSAFRSVYKRIGTHAFAER